MAEHTQLCVVIMEECDASWFEVYHSFHNLHYFISHHASTGVYQCKLRCCHKAPVTGNWHHLASTTTEMSGHNDRPSTLVDGQSDDMHGKMTDVRPLFRPLLDQYCCIVNARCMHSKGYSTQFVGGCVFCLQADYAWAVHMILPFRAMHTQPVHCMVSACPWACCAKH